MADTFQLTVVTPEAVAFDKTVKGAVLPAYDGEIGILAGHAAMVARLGYGELRVSGVTPGASAGGVGPAASADGKVSLFVDGGVVQVADNVVTVLTNGAVAADKLDPEKARKELAAAQSRKPTTLAGQEAKSADSARARAKIRLAEKVGKR
jgi:F-type H+-transporting ATPase subunit epsilon